MLPEAPAEPGDPARVAGQQQVPLRPALAAAPASASTRPRAACPQPGQHAVVPAARHGTAVGVPGGDEGRVTQAAVAQQRIQRGAAPADAGDDASAS
jgi:hypothetical protein